MDYIGSYNKKTYWSSKSEDTDGSIIGGKNNDGGLIQFQEVCLLMLTLCRMPLTSEDGMILV